MVLSRENIVTHILNNDFIPLKKLKPRCYTRLTIHFFLTMLHILHIEAVKELHSYMSFRTGSSLQIGMNPTKWRLRFDWIESYNQAYNPLDQVCSEIK